MAFLEILCYTKVTQIFSFFPLKFKVWPFHWKSSGHLDLTLAYGVTEGSPFIFEAVTLLSAVSLAPRGCELIKGSDRLLLRSLSPGTGRTLGECRPRERFVSILHEKPHLPGRM